MRFVAVLNSDGGTLRTIDADMFARRMEETLGSAGHSVEVLRVDGAGLVKTLQRAAAMRSADVVLAGGGDGTVSAAAAALMNRKKALAVLPAGTMNLFARGIGVPLGLEAAVKAFADGEVRAVDIATANGRPFIHQFSIGLHAKMVRLRDKMAFGSRLGKIGASMKAAFQTVMNPPSMDVELTIGEAEIRVRASGIGITNNLFGEGHLPYADHPDGGTLGVYITVARERREMLHLALNMLRGRWRDNEQVEIHQAERVVLKLKSRSRKFRCVIDGELCPLERETVLEIHPKALNVLVPRTEAASRAA